MLEIKVNKRDVNFKVDGRCDELVYEMADAIDSFCEAISTQSNLTKIEVLELLTKICIYQ